LGGTCLQGSTFARGRKAEQESADYLHANGFLLVCKNFRLSTGELDIIGFDNDVLCFVEVRSRVSAKFITPIDTISAKKKSRIISTAQAFLAQEQYRKFRNMPCRFDVISVLRSNLDNKEILWIKDAFRVPSKY
jgi:putative endonuclease